MQTVYSMRENEDLMADILALQFVQNDSQAKQKKLLFEDQPTERDDPNKQILDQLERNYIFLKEPQSRRMIAPILQKEIKHPVRYRISQRVPVNVVSQDKKMELDKLTLERAARQANERRFLEGPIEIGESVCCLIRKDKSGLFEMNSTYRLLLQSTGRFLMAAKKQTGTTTTYIISTNSKTICQTDKKYRGKITSNFLRKEWLLYDDGFNPAKVRELSECRKQLAYVVYEKKMFSGLPRRMSVVVPALDENLSPRKFRPLEGHNQLKHSLENESDEILQFRSRNHTKDCRLSFGGRVQDEQDGKNFILVADGQEEVLALGRLFPDEYFMEVHHPLSLFQAFAIALTNLDHKLFVD